MSSDRVLMRHPITGGTAAFTPRTVPSRERAGWVRAEQTTPDEPLEPTAPPSPKRARTRKPPERHAPAHRDDSTVGSSSDTKQ